MTCQALVPVFRLQGPVQLSCPAGVAFHPAASRGGPGQKTLAHRKMPCEPGDIISNGDGDANRDLIVDFLPRLG